MSSRITFEDSGLQKLSETLAELRRMKVRVGYQPPDGGARHDLDGGSDITIAKLAAVVEFGEGETPARSFIRSTIHEHQDAIADEEQRQVAAVVAGDKTPVEALSAVGRFVVGLIRAKLRSAAGWAAPLSAETAERKGSTAPLDDTGKLIEALSWRVSRGREELARGRE